MREEGMFGLFSVIEEVIRCAVGHFVVGRFTVVIVEQLPQAASAAVSQVA
jgi:hypothetical protein